MILKKLDQDVYEKEVIKSGGFALLCFFQNCISHGEAVSSIDELSRQFGSIQFYTAEEEALGFFFGKFQFLGTPVFIFLANGMERGRLMGTASIERLSSFIKKNISAVNAQWRVPGAPAHGTKRIEQDQLSTKDINHGLSIFS